MHVLSLVLPLRLEFGTSNACAKIQFRMFSPLLFELTPVHIQPVLNSSQPDDTCVVPIPTFCVRSPDRRYDPCSMPSLQQVECASAVLLQEFRKRLRRLHSRAP